MTINEKIKELEWEKNEKIKVWERENNEMIRRLEMVKEAIGRICDTTLKSEYSALSAVVQKRADEYRELRKAGCDKERINYARIELEKADVQMQECGRIMGLLRKMCE